MIAPGTRLGPYKIISQLGSGGMGEVYRALDLRLDREVALKVLSERLADNADALIRFEREAKAVAALSHSNILAIHEFDRDKDVYFAVTELLEGETLRMRMGDAPVPWRRTVEIAIEIANGLAAAHSRGVIHRDLKPENIFLTSDGQIKILDFGLAQIRHPKVHANAASISAADTEEKIVGTLGYMSPEQLRAATATDERSDIFSLGCIIYEMIAGQKPFWRKNAFDTVAAILKDDPPDLVDSGKNIPVELLNIIEHCLKKSPNERLQSAHDLAFELKSVLSRSQDSRYPQVEFRLPSSRILWIASIAILFVLSIYFYYALPHRTAINSIAVLPFENKSSDPDMEYLSDGITESIINNLAQVPNFRVMAPSTMSRYKGKQTDAEKIGHDLKVDVLLTGSVRQQENNLIIRASLVKTADGSGLWGDQYNLRFISILAVQKEISQKILEKLQLQLTGDQKERISHLHTESTEAYHSYLKGRYYWNKRTPDAFKKALAYFQEAIEKDPSYALAYAGLADCYALLGDYNVFAPAESFPRAKSAAMKALEIDGDLAEAHTTLAHLHMYYWDFPSAEKEFRRAIELKPGYPTAHQWFANYLTIIGRPEEALKEIHLAQELDPLSLIINLAVGSHLYYARRYDQAIAQYQKTIELDPHFAPVHAALASGYIQKAMYSNAIAEYQKAISLSGNHLDYQAELGYAYAISGNKEAARKTLEELDRQSKKTYVSPVYIARIYTGLGLKNEALKCLQNAYDQHTESIIFLRVDPTFDVLHSDPRFQRLLQRVGLSK